MEISNLTTDHTDNTDEKMIHEELSGEIIGAAMEVRTTGTGEALGRHITVFVMSSGVETSLDSSC
jgi:hypothetical protein